MEEQYSWQIQSEINKELLPATRVPDNIKTGHENQMLPEQTEELYLKTYASKTMVEIAEKETKIDIRKKCGIKQQHF